MCVATCLQWIPNISPHLSWSALRRTQQAPLKDHMMSFIWAAFPCVSVRRAHLCAGGQQSVWYLPEVLCQRAINRFKGHPPSPAPSYTQHYHQPMSHSTHGRTSLLAFPVKRRWAVSHDAVFRREKPSVVRAVMPIPYGQLGFSLLFRVSTYSGEIILYNVRSTINVSAS